MKIKAKNLINEKLIGLKVYIVPHNNDQIKWKGKIIDETYNLFIIQDEMSNKRLKIPKKGNLFRFDLDNKIFEINGRILVGRPEDRIKIRRKY
ncbi:MAG: ribonuclease P protein component 1 [Candidatus Helarchaeota archaeon]